MFSSFKKIVTHFFLLTSLGLSCLSIPALGQVTASDYTVGKRYNLVGQLTGVINPDPDGAGPRTFSAIRNTYNAQGMLVSVESGYLYAWQDHTIKPANWSGFVVETKKASSYDDWGRVLTESTQNAVGDIQLLKQYSYDSLGRLECEAVRMNPNAYYSLPLSACILGTSGANGRDRITKYTYDVKSRITLIEKAYATALRQDYVRYTYNQYWEKEDITDANGNRAQLRYDGFGRLKRWVFPSKTQTGALNEGDYEEYSYDANDNRTALRKRDGKVITYIPDNLNRIVAKNLPGNNVKYTYDNRGLELAALFTATNKGITTTYDGFGRIKTSTNNLSAASRTLSYEYDANGNRTRITHPDGNYFTYGYDQLNLITAVRENSTSGNVVITPSYDSTGDRTGLTFAGGSATTYTYDAISRLGSLTHNLSGTTHDITNSFTYNPANQITGRNISNNAYLYSGNQNLAGNYAVNGLNQYTSAGGKTFGYDNNSNLTNDGHGTTFSYDVENRLISASGAKNATLKYDPKGRLFEITSAGITTQFLYDGDALVAEYNTTGILLNRYVHGSRVDEPYLWYANNGVNATTRRNLHSDHQGSIIGVSNSTAGLIGINKYDVYGIPETTNIGRFSYTGQIYLPEVGLHYYKARIYSAQLGRFLQTDPVGYEDQMNLYAYVDNDPVNNIDPTGKILVPILKEALKQVAKTVAKNGAKEQGKKEAKDQAKDQAKDAAPKAGSQGGEGAGKPFSEKVKGQAREESGNKCVFCKTDTKKTDKPDPQRSHIDHAIPKSRTGNNSPENAQNTCQTCNLDKGTMTTEEYLRHMGQVGL